ncbi:MAG: DUF3251 domain-containing protein [Candidatus Omnitrophica bacterium]|nr:DUF3251 domain-containing protein [Candidatus Omnitrophota bacterium]
MKKCLAVFLILTLAQAGVALAQQASSAKVEELRKRVEKLEDYTEKLESGLNDFSKNLVSNLDQQLQGVRSNAVVVNPLSRKVSKIESNTGTFLLAVSRMDKIDGGYRLFLQIGNPNAATYGDVKFRVFWGSQFNAVSATMTYDKWRQTLKGSEFVYSGALEAGVWTDIAVDLKPAEYSQLQYIECEMEVNTVKLQKARPLEADTSSR